MDGYVQAFSIENQLSSSPAIRVSFLREHGLLQPKVSSKIRWCWDRHLMTYEMEGVWNADTERFSIFDRSIDQQVYEVGLSRVSTGRQQQTYFVDLSSKQRFRTIYFYSGKFGSRAGLGLKYPSKWITPAVARELALQRAELLEHPWPTPPDPDVVGRPSIKRRAGRDSAWSYWSSAAALAHAPPITNEHKVAAKAGVLAFLAQRSEAALSPPPRPKPWPADNLETGIWELQPRLDLFVLHSAGLLRDGAWEIFELPYDHDRARLTTLLVSIDLLDPKNPQVVLLSYYRSQDGVTKWGTWSYLQLTPPDSSPQRRRYIICPFSGRRVDSVAFRAGVWGSREALRLENASQRSRKYVERIERAVVDTPRIKPKIEKRQPRLRQKRR